MAALPMAPPSSAWTPTSLTRGDALAFAATDAVLLAALHDDVAGGLYGSTDAGATWTRVSHGLPRDGGITALAAGPSGLYAGTVGRGVFAGHAEGRRWRPADEGLPRPCTVLSLAVDGPRVFAGTERHGVYVSDDAGRRWRPLHEGLPLHGRLAVMALAAGPEGVYASHGFGLHHLAPGAGRWETVRTGLAAGVTLLTLHVGADGALVGSSAQGLFRSCDRGGTWTSLDAPAPDALVRTLVVDGDRLYLGTQGRADSGLFASADGGASWEPLHEGLPAPAWSVSVAVARGTLLAGVGEHGVWRRTQGWRPGAHAPSPRFRLLPNEPNPCDDRTRLAFELSHAAPVRLVVTDAAARECAVVWDGPAPAGAHEADLDVSAWPPGFYLCRLTVGRQSQTRQVLVLR